MKNVKVLEITKCEDCKFTDCKFRQMVGTIPDNCPLPDPDYFVKINDKNFEKSL
jgi:hypothetical protein